VIAMTKRQSTNRVGGNWRCGKPGWFGGGRCLVAVCAIGVSLIVSGCGAQSSSQARAVTNSDVRATTSANSCAHAAAAGARGPSQLLAAARCALLAQPAVEISQVGAYVESEPVPARVERQSVSLVQANGQIRQYADVVSTDLGVRRAVFTGGSAAVLVPLADEEREQHLPLGWSQLFAGRWLTGPGSVRAAASAIGCLNSQRSLVDPQERALAITGRATLAGRPVVILTAHGGTPAAESETLYIAATGPPLPLRRVLRQSATAPAQPGCAGGPRPRSATVTFSYRPLKITLPASTVRYDPQQIGTIVPRPDAAVILTPRGYTPITRATVAFWTRLASSGALGSKWQRTAARGQVLTVLITAQWAAMQAAAAGITISNAQIARELSTQRSLVRSAGIPLYILRETAENALLVAKLGPSDRAHPQALRALAAADRKNTICASNATSSACSNV
jgi:hypothetical protein